MGYRKKMIEVAIPLDAINEACKPETENPFLTGHPRSLHNWWARLPLVACRAVLFTSLIDDPGEAGAPPALLARIDALATPAGVTDADDETDVRRKKLFAFVAELVRWENTKNETIIGIARELIVAAVGDHPPPVLDPFCGRGSVPLEAQRLGLRAYGSDLNPVAVLITKALIEIPARFGARPPVNPDDAGRIGAGSSWKGATGLAADVRYYGKWIRDRAFERIGHLFPSAPDGQAVIAWLWARTVRCPNPACLARTPLLTTYVLSSKKGGERFLAPRVTKDAIEFDVVTRPVGGIAQAKAGAKRGVSGKFECLVCHSVTERNYVSEEGLAGRIESVQTGAVLDGARHREYVSALKCPATATTPPEDTAFLEAELAKNPRDVWCRNFGLTRSVDLFAPRQLVALTTFSEFVREARTLVREHAIAAGLKADGVGVEAGGTGADAYAESVAMYLGMAVSRLTDYHSTLCTWNPTNENVRNVFVRQALPMTWDYVEANPFGTKLDMVVAVGWIADGISATPTGVVEGTATQLDTSQALPMVAAPMVCTDPPYYDNIGYGDIADYFYVWLRASLKDVFPTIFATVQTPKSQELVALPYRWEGNSAAADTHFKEGFRRAFGNLRRVASTEYPLTVYYAYKQNDDGDGDAISSSGWETMLDGMIDAGFSVEASWPLRTTKAARAVAKDTNALSSAVVLVCRTRPEGAPIATLRQFQAALKVELPTALHHMIGGHIAPVDLAQAAIGPGMSVFSRYSRVLEPNGGDMTVRRALELVNAAVEEYFSEREGAFDAYTQFCARWFEQHRFNDGPFGQAEDLSRAKNVSVDAIARDGLLRSGGGKVRLWPLTHYIDHLESYDPSTDPHVTAWEACHYLIAALRKGGIAQAGRLAHRLGGMGAQGVELSYRLYAMCERNKWSEEALGYNELADSWAEIQAAMGGPEQGQMV